MIEVVIGRKGVSEGENKGISGGLVVVVVKAPGGNGKSICGGKNNDLMLLLVQVAEMVVR